MRALKLTLAYDGTDFHGWQVQPGKPTVQGALNEVLRRITQEPVTVHGAGRTDAGVHAEGQVAHFRTGSEMGTNEFRRALNALLPATIRVWSAEEVDAAFHARHSAVAKTYHYRIYRGAVAPPFACRYVLHYPYELDEAAMSEAAQRFVGEHDFSAFAASSGQDEDEASRRGKPSPVRCILESQIRRGGNAAAKGSTNGKRPGHELVYEVRGRSFLRYMVRKMVGTLLEVGRGRMKPEDIDALFASGDRSAAGPTVPPHGLCMMSVEYAQQTAHEPERAETSPCEKSRVSR